MSMLRYYLWMTLLPGLLPRDSEKLMAALGTPEMVYFASESQIKSVDGIAGKVAAAVKNKSLERAEQVMENCGRKGISIVTLSDAVYPGRLKNIPAPPQVLYVKGKLPDMDDEIAVSFVGQRKASVADLNIMQRLAYEFAASGGLVVSGMAKGMDGAAHRGAMRAGRPTVAVFGSGVDVIYPFENKEIYDYILTKGAVLSEYPPGTEPASAHFPARNRIISGLSLGVVVAAASARSGSLITASYALEQGRDLFAVPGNIDEADFEGSNRLLKEGAKPVTSAYDILEEYVSLYPHKIIEKSQRSLFLRQKKGPADKAAETQKPVRKAVPNQEDAVSDEGKPKQEKKTLPTGLSPAEIKIAEMLESENLHIDTMIERAGLPASEMLAAATMLEIKGIVKQLPGKFFERI